MHRQFQLTLLVFSTRTGYCPYSATTTRNSSGSSRRNRILGHVSKLDIREFLLPKPSTWYSTSRGSSPHSAWDKNKSSQDMATRKGDKKSSELTEKLLPPEQGEGVARQGAAGGDDIEREQRVVIHEESNVSLHEATANHLHRSALLRLYSVLTCPFTNSSTPRIRDAKAEGHERRPGRHLEDEAGCLAPYTCYNMRSACCAALSAPHALRHRVLARPATSQPLILLTWALCPGFGRILEKVSDHAGALVALLDRRAGLAPPPLLVPVRKWCNSAILTSAAGQ
eukprot:1946125-Rhodomonas_salina.1